MKVLIVSQHFPPDYGAVSFRMKDLAHQLKENGHDVRVLTAQPHRYNLQSYPNKDTDSYEVKRISLKFQGSSIFSRIFGFFEFYFKARKKWKTYKGVSLDVIISTTPYMLEGLAGQFLAKKLKTKHVLDVRDLWPDTPIALNAIRKNGPMAFILRRLEQRLYSNADGIVVTSPGYIEHIKNLCNSPRLEVVLNGIDSEMLNTKKAIYTAVSSERPIKLLYAGNIGVAQDLMSFIKMIRNEASLIDFEIIGAGSQLNSIVDYIQENNLHHITIKEPKSRFDLMKSYQNADILYLQLHANAYFDKVIPSKIFEYLATQKPVIYKLDGSAHEILKGYPMTYQLNEFSLDSLKELISDALEEKRVLRKLDSLQRKQQSQKYVNFIEKVAQNG